MARQSTVTNETLAQLTERALDARNDIATIADRLQKTYGGEPLADLISASSTFATLARDSAQLAATLLHRHKLQEQQSELERLREQAERTGVKL